MMFYFQFYISVEFILLLLTINVLFFFCFHDIYNIVLFILWFFLHSFIFKHFPMTFCGDKIMIK